jgi:DNA-binding transcriptional ArsR family regulator
MESDDAIAALGALAQATRLDIFRIAVAAHPEPVGAGEFARRCGVPHNTMSTHLAILTRAGLLASARDGRAMHYRFRLEGFRELMKFLSGDCCGGRPEICAPLLADLVPCCPPARRSPRARPSA